MALSEKQRGVRAGMATATVTAIVVIGGAVWLAPAALVPGDDIANRLAHVLRWDLLVVVWLLVMIGNLARHRFFTPADIDGSGLTSGTDTARIHQSVLQNTLEQTVLAVVIHLAAAVLLPVGWLAAVPAAAILFALGRLLFWRGYRGGAAARAVGFALTFYSTAVLLVVVLVSLVRTF